MTKKSLTTAALLGAITTGLAATAFTPVIAAELHEKAADKNMEKTKASKDIIKVSEDALMTMRNVGGARLALFNGTPDKAQTYADAAVTRATATLKDADKYALDIKQSKKDGQTYVPFNTGLTVMETMEPGKKHEDVATAIRHMHNGDRNKDEQALKVDGVNVALTTELIPIQMARTQIEDAARLIGEGKYYKANLALKAVEDSVVTQILDTDALQKNKARS